MLDRRVPDHFAAICEDTLTGVDPVHSKIYEVRHHARLVVPDIPRAMRGVDVRQLTVTKNRGDGRFRPVRNPVQLGLGMTSQPPIAYTPSLQGIAESIKVFRRSTTPA